MFGTDFGAFILVSFIVWLFIIAISIVLFYVIWQSRRQPIEYPGARLVAYILITIVAFSTIIAIVLATMFFYNQWLSVALLLTINAAILSLLRYTKLIEKGFELDAQQKAQKIILYALIFTLLAVPIALLMYQQRTAAAIYPRNQQ